MSTEPFVGEVKLLGFYFPPLGYMTCQGQLLSIAQNTALFSLLGTTYGGDGQTTFALPDLQGRVPTGQGQGPGLPYYTIGEEAGSTSTTLVTANLPPHIHTSPGLTVNVPVSTGGTDQSSPAGGYLADQGTDTYSSISTPNQHYGVNITMGGQTSPAGSNAAFSIENPYLVMNFSIATEGIFPSRN